MYAYNAELWCDSCGELIAAELTEKGVADTGDTNDFPQYFNESDSETDSPSHCGECGELIHERLTRYGETYVADAIVEHYAYGEGVGDVVKEWAETFGIPWPEGIPSLALRELADHLGDSLDALRVVEDGGYCGVFDGRGDSAIGDYLSVLADDCGDLRGVPDWIRYHIDWEGIGRDGRLSGEYLAVPLDPGTSYVFRIL